MLTSEELQKKYFRSYDHPYNIYERKIESVLKNSSTILDAGCGRTAPILSKFKNKAQHLIGVDLEDPIGVHGIRYIKGDIANIDVPSNFVNLVISRAVFEHVKYPEFVFKEINRILKPNGDFIFLVPNTYDYVSIFSKIIPNKYHQSIVSKTEGRKMDDVFPAYYKANTFSSIKRLCVNHNFSIKSFQWIGQYPSTLMFNSYLFAIGTIYEKLISHFQCLRFLRGWLLVHLIKKNLKNE